VQSVGDAAQGQVDVAFYFEIRPGRPVLEAGDVDEVG
jgi:hypothetical protein